MALYPILIIGNALATCQISANSAGCDLSTEVLSPFLLFESCHLINDRPQRDPPRPEKNECNSTDHPEAGGAVGLYLARVVERHASACLRTVGVD